MTRRYGNLVNAKGPLYPGVAVLDATTLGYNGAKAIRTNVLHIAFIKR